MEFDEIPGDELSEPFEDDLEEFERNQVANDHEGEERESEETSLDEEPEEWGDLSE